MKSPQMLAIIVSGMIGISPGLASATVTFQEGVAGYTGTQDTQLKERKPDNNYGNKDEMRIDGDNPDKQALLRFDDIFGIGPSLIPQFENFGEATLRFYLESGGTDVQMWKMTTDWDENTATWNSHEIGTGNAILLRTLEGRPDSDKPLSDTRSYVNIDVTSEMLDWAYEIDENYGWGFTALGTDSVDIYTSDAENISYRPELIVRYVPEPGTLAIFGMGLVGLGLYRRKRAA